MSEFAALRRQQMQFKNAAEMMDEGLAPLNDPELVVNGPMLIDKNMRKWHRGDFMTIVGSSGIGKTSFILWLYKNILMNNPKGVCVLIACEMSRAQLLNKWHKATKDVPEISSRLYIITAYDDDGNSNDLSIRGIKHYLNIIKNSVDVEILSFICDHLHIIKRDDNETLDDVAYGFSSLCKEINSLGILTAQTTKSKSGEGDMPLDKGSVFGTSVVTWESAYMITLCQPLKTLGIKDFPVTSWQLAKNRFKEDGDNVVESINYLLKFDYKTEGYKTLTSEEMANFKLYFDEVLEYRKAKEKTGEVMFDTSYEVENKKTGKVVKINSEYGSENRWN